MHRMIFLVHHGYLPEVIDHIDGNQDNNNIKNLRGVTLSQNQFNRKIDKRSTTGVKGVTWCKKNQRYVAQIRIHYKEHYVGSFKALEDATKAIIEFREKHHGEFARHE